MYLGTGLKSCSLIGVSFITITPVRTITRLMLLCCRPLNPHNSSLHDGLTIAGVAVKSCEWVRVGSQRTAPQVNHASCYNVYAGITRYGVTSMCTVAGTTKHTSCYTNKKGQPSKNITNHEYIMMCLQSTCCQRAEDSSHLLGSAIGFFNKTMTHHTELPQKEHCKIGGSRLLAMLWSSCP